jgi:hypothetical protein
MDLKYEPYWSSYLKQFAEDKIPSSFFQDIKGPGETDKFCVIVETREHPLLHLVCRNFMALLKSKGWGLIVFHGTENEKYLREGLRDWKKVMLFQLGIPQLGIPQHGFNGYSDLLRGEKFWRSLQSTGCRHALIFQTDCILRKDNVDEYLPYDYVGAPWSTQPNRKFLNICEIGNGGLSLRNVNTMIEIIQKYSDDPSFPDKLIPGYAEDIWFSYWLKTKGYKLPSLEKAKEFAVETVWSPDPIGVHRPYVNEFNSHWDFVHLTTKEYTFS